jgi:hypothetical protein
MDGYLFRIHHYLFLPDGGNIVNELLNERECSAIQPFTFPDDIKMVSFERVLDILYWQ